MKKNPCLGVVSSCNLFTGKCRKSHLLAVHGQLTSVGNLYKITLTRALFWVLQQSLIEDIKTMGEESQAAWYYGYSIVTIVFCTLISHELVLPPLHSPSDPQALLCWSASWVLPLAVDDVWMIWVWLRNWLKQGLVKDVWIGLGTCFLPVPTKVWSSAATTITTTEEEHETT